jgi:hypothetical protein
MYVDVGKQVIVKRRHIVYLSTITITMSQGLVSEAIRSCCSCSCLSLLPNLPLDLDRSDYRDPTSTDMIMFYFASASLHFSRPSASLHNLGYCLTASLSHTVASYPVSPSRLRRKKREEGEGRLFMRRRTNPPLWTFLFQIRAFQIPTDN